MVYRARGGFAFAVDRDDPFQAMMLLGAYDPVIEHLVHRYTPVGGTVIDGGAHLGYFSLRFARLVGPTGAVHAFECDPRLVPRLERHVQLNALPWIKVNATGLSDREDTSELYLPDQLGWSSTLKGAWGATERATVAMTTIDRYVRDTEIDPTRLSFIKLDIEGSEAAALRGAYGVLRATSAPVLLEYLPERLGEMNEAADDLLALMDDLGYEPWAPAIGSRGKVELRPGTRPSVGEDLVFLKRNR